MQSDWRTETQMTHSEATEGEREYVSVNKLAEKRGRRMSLLLDDVLGLGHKVKRLSVRDLATRRIEELGGRVRVRDLVSYLAREYRTPKGERLDDIRAAVQTLYRDGHVAIVQKADEGNR